MKTLKLTAIGLCVALVALFFGFGGGQDQSAYADVLKGIQEAQTMTWTKTYYERVTSEDGKRTWLRPERALHAYQQPGLYRETRLDQDGNPLWIEISDVSAGRILRLYPKDKKAELKANSTFLPNARGPFAWVLEVLKDRTMGKTLRVKSVTFVEQRQTEKGKVNVLRATVETGLDEGYVSYDFWIGTESKHLVEIHSPGADRFDPSTAEDRNNPPEDKWSMRAIYGGIEHEIVLNAKLDPNQFSLKVPEGYETTSTTRATVSEEEMIEYLGAAARFNGDVFTDSPYGLAVNREAFNKASSKDEKERTKAEQKLIDLHFKYVAADLNKLPVRHFDEDQTVEGSFNYVGSGLKLGTADRMIAWFRLKSTGKLRAVYGDLSVKDVTSADLPVDLK